MSYKEISYEELLNLLRFWTNNPDRRKEMKQEQYLTKGPQGYIVVDNRSHEFFVEDFEDLDEAIQRFDN